MVALGDWEATSNWLSSALAYTIPLICVCGMQTVPTLGTVATSALVTILLLGNAMSVVLHRYFSHRAFSASRGCQLMMACFSCFALQGGVLWWASKHARHHRYCDGPGDPHSWSRTSFWYAFVGWTLNVDELRVDQDFNQWKGFPELIVVDRCWLVVPVSLWVWLWGTVGADATVMVAMVPMFLCRLITQLFNCEYHPPTSGTVAVCKATDTVRFLSECVGESHHADHHRVPSRARRPGWDVPYVTTIRPLERLGLIRCRHRQIQPP